MGSYYFSLLSCIILPMYAAKQGIVASVPSLAHCKVRASGT